jgi:tRNA(Ile)-lysidine synthase
MHKRSPDDLPKIIEAHLPPGASGELLIGLSGGLDSTVLLHALARRWPQRVRAVYINHALHADASAWGEHCARLARECAVAFLARSVTIDANPQEGIESAARFARYEAFRELLQPGETLLTAHHADDQLETVLLALVRGSGVEGLAAMPRCQRCGVGWHLRPLLDFTRNELLHWASERGLRWLDDPSNDNTRFDRNFLRSGVVPALRSRWPSVAQAAVRTASHLGEASDLLDELAAHDFAAAAIGPCLKMSALRALEGPRRRNLLRYWLRSCGARAPSTRKLAALEHDMLAADDDRLPCIEWDAIEVRRHRDLLYCCPRVPLTDAMDFEWAWRSPARLAAAPGTLRAEIAHGRGLKRACLPERVRIRTRAGGERLRLPGHKHHRELKKLLQEANVLPWWRDRLPLVCVGDTLIAVADLWIDADYAASDDDEGVRLIWDGRPQLEGIDAAHD